MDKIDWQTSKFNPKFILPEINDGLTVPWGISLVNNITSGMGLVGTIKLELNVPQSIPLPLSHLFQGAPRLEIFWSDNEGITWYKVRNGNPIKHEVYWAYDGEKISFRKGFQENPELPLLVVYKIHGV